MTSTQNKLDPSLPSHTHVGEPEFLFTAYSIFSIRSVQWGENRAPHRIEIYAPTDRRAQVEVGDGPLATRNLRLRRGTERGCILVSECIA